MALIVSWNNFFADLASKLPLDFSFVVLALLAVSFYGALFFGALLFVKVAVDVVVFLRLATISFFSDSGSA